jgi:hypothetical protein
MLKANEPPSHFMPPKFCHPKILKSIMRDAGLSAEALEKLL